MERLDIAITTITDLINGRDVSFQAKKEVLSFLEGLRPEERVDLDDDIMQFVGKLKKRFGIKGYKVAVEGHPVFRRKDRYVIILEPETAKIPLEVPFYIESLHSSIEFEENPLNLYGN